MHPPNPMMLLGTLIERSEAHQRLLEKIDRRLEKGDVRMDEMTDATRQVDRRIEELAARKPKAEGEMPTWERIVKLLAPWVIVPLMAWATGSWQVAIEMLKAVPR